MGIIDKLKIKAGHEKLATKMLRKQGMGSFNMSEGGYNKATKTLKGHMKKGDMVSARKYAQSQREKANSQGYTME